MAHAVVSDDDIDAFIELYPNTAGYFYTFVPGKATAAGAKQEGRYNLVGSNPERDDYADHLTGKGEGLSLLMHQADAKGLFTSVRYAAVDVDIYGSVNLVAENERRLKLHIPGVFNLTKSSGFHFRLFFKSAISAARARNLVERVALAMEWEKCDLFPKQGEIDAGANKGNGLNAPYHGTSRAGWANGDFISITRYVDECYTQALSEEEILDLEKRLPYSNAPSSQKSAPAVDAGLRDRLQALDKSNLPFYDGPPCLQQLVADGDKVDAARNNFIYNSAIYHMYNTAPREVNDLVDLTMSDNFRFVQPPLSTTEVTQTTKSAFKSKNPSYLCKEDPICGLCVKRVCNNRRNGVAQRGTKPPFNATTVFKFQPSEGEFASLEPIVVVNYGSNMDGVRITKTYRGWKDPDLNYQNMVHFAESHGFAFMEGQTLQSFSTMMGAVRRSAERIYDNLDNRVGRLATALKNFIDAKAPLKQKYALLADRGAGATAHYVTSRGKHSGCALVLESVLMGYLDWNMNIRSEMDFDVNWVMRSQLGIEFEFQTFFLPSQSTKVETHLVAIIDMAKLETQLARFRALLDQETSDQEQREATEASPIQLVVDNTAANTPSPAIDDMDDADFPI
jgi:hypothetical protein